ncbi:hypothetical protein GCM10010123_42520 [Pilimelia anulata]|uniref:Uncharacterized protein n=1 Tax=Pilimelia anulata TaxID=53371 RepID=A0A8J3FCC9_9ACTN|nr:RICIN domain-containing protein [Pilimelia anulata]GGK08057.1 hypothetical protein GCM10010123_42520 [Pilimelia anulata]
MHPGPAADSRAAGGPETGSLPLAALIVLVCVGLAAALAPVALTQIGSTRGSLQRMYALQAAQSGLEVGVAGIRAAYGASGGDGDRSRLPCGTVTGSGGAEARATYSLLINYYPDRPTGGSTPLSCAAARGTGAVPDYAMLTSTGTTASGSTARRALRGLYPLRRTTVSPDPTPTYGPENDYSIQPRMILAWSPGSGSTDVCLDPGTAVPGADATPRMRLCDSLDHRNAGYKQNWYYRENLTIATVGSLLSGRAMCLDAGATPVAGRSPTMQPCAEPAPPRQRWFYNKYSNIELAAAAGAGPDDLALSGLCLNVASPGTAGSAVVLGTGGNCHSSSYSTRQTFALSTKTGPGWATRRQADCTAAAGYPCTLRQVVNFINPSRCLDRYDDFSANMECDQEPQLTDTRWNQLWRVPRTVDGPAGTTGPLVTVDTSGRTYCLTASTEFPVQRACNPRSPTADQTFTLYGDTGAYATMYRILDSRGRCMTHPNDNKNGVESSFYWNHANWNWKIRMDACATRRSPPEAFNYAALSDRQKWNAPPVLPTGDQTPGPTTPTTAPPPPAASSTTPLEEVVEVP